VSKSINCGCQGFSKKKSDLWGTPIITLRHICPDMMNSLHIGTMEQDLKICHLIPKLVLNVCLATILDITYFFFIPWTNELKLLCIKDTSMISIPAHYNVLSLSTGISTVWLKKVYGHITSLIRWMCHHCPNMSALYISQFNSNLLITNLFGHNASLRTFFIQANTFGSSNQVSVAWVQHLLLPVKFDKLQYIAAVVSIQPGDEFHLEHIIFALGMYSTEGIQLQLISQSSCLRSLINVFNIAIKCKPFTQRIQLWQLKSRRIPVYACIWTVTKSVNTIGKVALPPNLQSFLFMYSFIRGDLFVPLISSSVWTVVLPSISMCTCKLCLNKFTEFL
jgi:hypothetical protein